MMPFLKKQQLEFAIYVVELAPKETFNRAMLMNIGFVFVRQPMKMVIWSDIVFNAPPYLEIVLVPCFVVFGRR